MIDLLSVADNIALHLSVSGQDNRDDTTNLKELLAWVGLSHRANALPPELSGGERQRAALARAIIMSPDIVLADEPTGNVDWEMSERLLRLLLELNRMGKTVVIASHDLSLIRSAKSQVQARVLRIANKRLQLAGANLSALFSALAALFVGDLQRDRVVPASGYTSTLTSLTAAAMAFLVVFALALSLASYRLAQDWSEALDQSATLRISAPVEQLDAQVARAIEILETTPVLPRHARSAVRSSPIY